MVELGTNKRKVKWVRVQRTVECINKNTMYVCSKTCVRNLNDLTDDKGRKVRKTLKIRKASVGRRKEGAQGHTIWTYCAATQENIQVLTVDKPILVATTGRISGS